MRLEAILYYRKNNAVSRFLKMQFFCSLTYYNFCHSVNEPLRHFTLWKNLRYIAGLKMQITLSSLQKPTSLAQFSPECKRALIYLSE
jgi:hypothetical protein